MDAIKLTRVQNHSLSRDQILFIEHENHCPLCGETLKISVKTYLENYTLHEEARCVTCDVKVRAKDHKMQ